MNESFSELFENSLKCLDWQPGTVVEAVVVSESPEYVVVDAHLKSEGTIPRSEFHGETIHVGDRVQVMIRKPENGFGETKLSREEARRLQNWMDLETLYQNEETVVGTILERVKGGLTVSIGSLRAFLPGSLVDIKPIRDFSGFEQKDFEFKIIKMDKLRNNIVLSRRAVLERETSVEREALLSGLEEGQEIQGVVKNITDYGAFVDLGGVDGLLHITDMSWKRIRHPSEVLAVGDKLFVRVLHFDRDKNRISLGIKQLGSDPWSNIMKRYKPGDRLKGHITNITDYGCFVQLEEGVEGLVHMSEMDWTNKNIHPSKVIQLNELVEVVVLEVSEERRRISLGIKQCRENPWAVFAQQHQSGERVTGKISSVTDFGLFIGLPGGIDGLIHLSDISWNENSEDILRKYKKGETVEAMILSIDADRERIALGVKQLQFDPIYEYAQANQDFIINAQVESIEAKQAVLSLTENISGIMRLADYSQDRIKDLRQELHVGEFIKVKILNYDQKARILNVSHRVLEKKYNESQQTEDAISDGTLGDLLRAHMQEKERS